MRGKQQEKGDKEISFKCDLRESLSEKVTFSQILEEAKAGKHVAMWEEDFYIEEPRTEILTLL